MRRNIWRFALLLCALAALPLAAQQHPTHARGYDVTQIYQFDGVDSVNLFNGNVGLRIPIGGTYPVSENFSYGLTLTYNSKVWDHIERMDAYGTYVEVVPSRRSNAGFGWLLSPGRLFPPGHPTNESGRWIYEDPSGAEHLLFSGPLYVGDSSSSYTGVRYSRDGSYLRMRDVSTSTIEVDFPDGSIHRFAQTSDGSWRATQLRSAFGSTVTVGYATDGMSWWMSDPRGRTQYVYLTTWGNPQSNYAKLVDRVVLSAFNGTTAQYKFNYTDMTFTRGCANNYPYNSTHVTVPILSRLDLPDGSSYSATYIPDPVAGDCRQGGISRLNLPTLGAIEWTYQTYRYPSQNCQDGGGTWYNNVPGVETRRFLDASNVEQARWTYAWTLSPWVYGDWCDSGAFAIRRTVEEHIAVTVTTPSLDRNVYYFSVWPEPVASENGAVREDYGLPFTRRQTDSTGTRYLSTESYDCDAAGNCPSTPARSHYVRYERDAQECWAIGYGCLDIHRRLVSERTQFHDDAGRVADTDYTDFDGFGHYRQIATSGNFPAGNSRTAVTNYNPGTDSKGKTNGVFRFPSTSRWVLKTYDETSTTEGSTTHRQQTCFEASTGFLLRKRIQKDSVRGPSDVLAVYTRDTNGNLLSEEWYGGDTQSIGTATDLCTLPLPANPWGLSDHQYRIEYTYQFGARRTAQYRDANTSVSGTLLSHKHLDLDVDQNTGLVRVSRDSAGLATTFEYDNMSRLTWTKPAAGHGAWVQNVYGNATSASSLAQVTTIQRPNGSTTGVLAERVVTFDSFGRPWRDREKLPDGSWNVQETRYDGMGRKSMVSSREPYSAFSSPSNWTTYTYDWSGRLLRERPPDGAAHDVTYSYTGTRLVQRTTPIATSTTAESAVTVTEEYDRQGRLWRVTEPSGTNGASIVTQYAYDPSDRLRSVCAGASGFCTQQRVFNYDGRGFLGSSQQPEQGTYGNGVASFTYDARGHQRTSRQGAAGGPFDITFIRDRAERVVQVRETGGSQRLLKEFSYATANGTGDLANGRLRMARRHNLLDRWGMNVMVTETYTYGGRDGRPSYRLTEINEYNSAGQQVNYKGWTQTWSWTELGLPETIGYPACLSGTPCAAISSGRTVSHGYQNGWLQSISDQNGSIVSSMQYHANGMLWQIAHSNGVTSVFERDPYYMRRLSSARATYGTTTYWNSGAYSYDGAGNLKRAGNDTYVYDRASRVIEGTSESAKKQTYAYDGYGNLTQMVTIVNGTVTASRSMAVDAATNRIVSGGSVVATYDEAGNQTGQNGTQSYGYDPFNMMRSRMSSGKDLTFLYTADDERIWEFDAILNRSDYTVRNLDGKVLRVFRQDGDTWSWRQDYVHRPGALVAGVNAYGTYHFHVDHLGTPRSITDRFRGVSGTHHYYPFGEESTSNAQNSERMKFTGHERDTTFSNDLDYLDYMHARYYNPTTGRFLGMDPYLDVEKSKVLPQMWNRYAYVANNPLRFTDPTGKAIWDIVGRAGIEVLAYVGRKSEKVIARIAPQSKNKTMQRVREAVDKAHEEGATSVAVVTRTEAGRDAVARQLSPTGKARKVERSGNWPAHRNPDGGPYQNVHVQTVEDTKAAGLGKSLLSIVAATTLATTANPDATPREIVSAVLWDTAKAIDPIFITDGIEYATGLNEYTQPPQ